jgi:predicted negative regulator of RcsB-dependent stress response
VARKFDRTDRFIRVLFVTLAVFIALTNTAFFSYSLYHSAQVSHLRTRENVAQVAQAEQQAAQGKEIIALLAQSHATGLANQQILKIVQNVTSAQSAAQSAATLKLAVTCIADVVNVDTGRPGARIPGTCAAVLDPP